MAIPHFTRNRHIHVEEESHTLAIPHVGVVKPDMLAKWRKWGVPENIIERAIKQRTLILEIRKKEEWITIPDFAYKLPRLPKIEANPWGFAKIIDTEGHIAVRFRYVADKIRKTDRWE